MDLIISGGEGTRRRRRRDGSASTVAALLCCCCGLFCLFSIYALSMRTPHYSGVELSLKSILHVQEEEEEEEATVVFAGGGRRRRELSGGSWGPGSYPPLCTAKCGDCKPCSPVHVAVPPGRPVIDEYYPEAWRCKCGNKLYMP